MSVAHVHRWLRFLARPALSTIIFTITLSSFAQDRVPSAAAPVVNQPSPAKPNALAANAVFDVASIHANNSDHSSRSHIYSYANQGHFVAINATLMQLLQYAFVLPDSRILDCPAWTKSAKFDVEAKSGPELASQLAALPYPDAKLQLLKMVQSLLAERFHLAAHKESRELPVYELLVARGGTKFSPVKDESTTIDTGAHSGVGPAVR